MKTYKEYCEFLFDVLPQFKYIAFDKNLTLFASSELPVKCDSEQKWRAISGSYQRVCSLSEFDLTEMPSWDESIVSRPLSLKRIPIVHKDGYWRAGGYIVNTADGMCGFKCYEDADGDTYTSFADILAKCKRRPLDLTGWTVVVES